MSDDAELPGAASGTSGSGPASEFEADTAVVAEGEVWLGEVKARWNIGENPNGGYLLAIAVRAMIAVAGRPDPLTVTAHYLSPPTAGAVTVRTEVVKGGRNLVTVMAGLYQGDRERVRLLGVFGDLSARTGPTRISARPPEIAPPEECVALPEMARRAGWSMGAARDRFDFRLPAESPWGVPGTAGPSEIVGWIRFRDLTPPSALSLVTFVDVWPPSLVGSTEVGWVPTIELTVHVRSRPAPGWLLGRFRTSVLIDGLMEEDGELWDGAGRPVAMSRQLAMVLPPPPPS